MSLGFDLPIKHKLLAGFLTVAFLGGLLTLTAGAVLINNLVFDEAQRRVTAGVHTAAAMLDQKQFELESVSVLIAKMIGRSDTSSEYLDKLRQEGGYDFLQLVDADGTVYAGSGASLAPSPDSPLVRQALHDNLPGSGLRALSGEVASEGAVFAEMLAMEAAAPLRNAAGEAVGAVYLGCIFNDDTETVDHFRDSIFSEMSVNGANPGTVTIFLHDMRIATNVIGPDGKRAVGTRVSPQVKAEVLAAGQTWAGAALVVDTWYISAYHPLRDTAGDIIGMLYVGVPKERYDELGRRWLGLLAAIVLVAGLVAIAVGSWLARRMARPITRLTDAAEEVRHGNLEIRLPEPSRGERDELKRMTLAFNEMLSAIKQRDVQLRRGHQELERTADELERWNQNYLDTLEFITHELKNQIAAMKLNLLAMRDGYVGELDAEQKEAVEDVLSTIARTEEMIVNYLNLSRIEKGELQVRARPVHVRREVIEPVLRELKGRFDSRKMQVDVEMDDDLVVQADVSLLQIVYANLLGNAAKYGEKGGRVRLWGRRMEEYWELHVWNSGQGVPLEHLDELFGKFSRLEPVGEQERGTGLGLFIDREIVRQHGGKIWAQTEPGEWIDFIFTLPSPDVVLPDEADNRSGSPVERRRIIG